MRGESGHEPHERHPFRPNATRRDLPAPSMGAGLGVGALLPASLRRRAVGADRASFGRIAPTPPSQPFPHPPTGKAPFLGGKERYSAARR
jgi:hypothetical protein